MTYRAVFLMLAAQLLVLLLLVSSSTLNISPISWNEQGEYQISAIGHGSYADDAQEINAQINTIVGSYYDASADNHKVRYTVLCSDSKLTILELVVTCANQETGRYDLLREQLWIDTSQRGKAVLWQMGDPSEFLTYSQSLRPSKPF